MLEQEEVCGRCGVEEGEVEEFDYPCICNECLEKESN